jgi:hypothetical protein
MWIIEEQADELGYVAVQRRSGGDAPAWRRWLSLWLGR